MPEQKKGPPQRSKTKSPRPANTVEGDSLHTLGSLNYSPKKPDWDYWKKVDLWTLGQAVCLICGCNPERLNADGHPSRYSPRFSSRFFGGNQSKALQKVYELAVTAIEAGKLNTAGPSDHSKDDLYKKIEPRYFVSWAKSKGISIPDELDGFKEQERPSDRELTNPDQWMTYSELKARWGNKPDVDLIPLLHNNRLYAYRFSPPSPGWRDIAPPFDRFEPKPDDDLKNCYFIRFHVADFERDHPELIGDKKVDEGAAENYVRTAAQRIKEVGFKSRDEVANDPVIKQICKEQNILFEPTLRKKLAPFNVLPKGKPWSKKKPENRS